MLRFGNAHRQISKIALLLFVCAIIYDVCQLRSLHLI